MPESGRFLKQRVGVFVDIQNMYYSARAVHGKKVNFKNILETAVGGRQLVRALAYGITTEEAHEEEFHSALAKQGFEVKTKPLQQFYGGQKKGDWDIGIAMDVLRLEPKIDVVVLISGDGDFVPLVQFTQEKGTRLEVMGFRESTSSALVAAADQFTDLSGQPETFLISDAAWSGAQRRRPGTRQRTVSPRDGKAVRRPSSRRSASATPRRSTRRTPRIRR